MSATAYAPDTALIYLPDNVSSVTPVETPPVVLVTPPEPVTAVTDRILAEALTYYADRRGMNNHKGWDHVLRKVEDGVDKNLFGYVTPAEMAYVRKILSILVGS